ncbi:hypothetical protein F5Y07DRAFT_224311 [Xylaria sp. FL0933]|nr:hypothetical protein F5Y07DRAFT_224311 [Xylaria sp. FL0933]
MSQEIPGSGRSLTSDSVDDDNRPGSSALPLSPNLTERQQGFKRWCPFHSSRTHTLDQCESKWEFLRNEQRVKWLLFMSCSAGPAFATNLLDWRCLMDPDMHITPPWTPEFARLEKKKKDTVSRDSLHYYPKPDPSTSRNERLHKLGWQTENGEKPRFSSFRELQEYAQQQCRESALKRNEALRLFKKHDAAEEEAKKAKDDLVKAHADDPGLLNMFDQFSKSKAHRATSSTERVAASITSQGRALTNSPGLGPSDPAPKASKKRPYSEDHGESPKRR